MCLKFCRWEFLPEKTYFKFIMCNFLKFKKNWFFMVFLGDLEVGGTMHAHSSYIQKPRTIEYLALDTHFIHDLKLTCIKGLFKLCISVVLNHKCSSC